MGLVSVELHPIDEVFQLAVDAHLGEALLPYLFEELSVVSFPASDDGGENVYFLGGVVLHYHLGDMFFGVTHHFLACVI